MDKISPERRSANMRAIRSKNTSPEMAVRRLLHQMGYRFPLHCKDLPGKPDLVLPKYRLAIFVHGCYWHRHPGCFYASTPKSHVEFWQEKFERNVERDRRQQRELIEKEWRVLVVWQCGLRFCRDAIGDLEEPIEDLSVYAEWPATPPRKR